MHLNKVCIGLSDRQEATQPTRRAIQSTRWIIFAKQFDMLLYMYLPVSSFWKVETVEVQILWLWCCICVSQANSSITMLQYEFTKVAECHFSIS
jgi:hypothetical protein